MTKSWTDQLSLVTSEIISIIPGSPKFANIGGEFPKGSRYGITNRLVRNIHLIIDGAAILPLDRCVNVLP